MADNRSSALAPFLIAALLLAVPPAAYVGGYFWLSEQSEMLDMDASGQCHREIQRDFSRPWLVKLYQPAAQVEARLAGCPVYLVAEPADW